MNILVTGFPGFLGSRLTRCFLARGHSVSGLKLSCSDTGRVADLLDKIPWFDTDDTPLREIFSRHRFDAVVNTATLYGRAGEAVTKMLEANVLFPVELLYAYKELNAGVDRHFVNIDTLLHRETSPYSLTKHQFRDWMRLSHDLGDVRISNVKLEHMYGPGDDNGKFITRIINQLLENVDHIDLTEGSHHRNFIFIDDVVDAICRVIDSTNEYSYREFDVDTREQISIRDLVEKISTFVGRFKEVRTALRFGTVATRPMDGIPIVSDPGPIDALGWKPSTSLDEGLLHTVRHCIDSKAESKKRD